MIVERIWTGNAYRNFNYLIVCSETGDALAVDPLDYQKCLDAAKKNGWNISQIANTHEHGDHTGGNKGMVQATGASIIAHKNAGDRIPGMTRGVGNGDTIKVGNSVELECLDTPGHTMSHICLFSHSDTPSLFSGDTLFNAGAGNCHNGGHPNELYETFASQLANLPTNTKIYPGHDYLINNLQFTLDREPDNKVAQEMIQKHKNSDPSNIITTLADEMEFNTFFRLQNPIIIKRLKESFTDLSEHPSPKEVFIKLRELRNSW